MKWSLTQWNVRIGDYAALAFPLAFALTTYEIIVRQVFGAPTIWTLEVALLTSGVAYITTGPQANALNSHIRIEVFIDMVAAGTRVWLDRFADFMSILFGAVIAYSGWMLARPLVEGIERTGSALNSPAPTIIKLLIPVVGLLMCAQSLSRLVNSFRSATRAGERSADVD